MNRNLQSLRNSGGFQKSLENYVILGFSLVSESLTFSKNHDASRVSSIDGSMSTTRNLFCYLSSLLLTANRGIGVDLNGQDLSHRKSGLTLTIHDAFGNPVEDAIVGVRIKKHALKISTQVRDRFFR
jgi:hypothetical protein